ncbi:MAG TPA: RNA-binding protein [Verrucomicrobiae bacterium]|nr:RNA-binding protein [Verrucomicrobiae bacterium]
MKIQILGLPVVEVGVGQKANQDAMAFNDFQLRKLFKQFGKITDAVVLTDKTTTLPKGEGYVTMDDEAGKAAIEALNGTAFQGRTLRLTAAIPHEPSSTRSRRSYE